MWFAFDGWFFFTNLLPYYPTNHPFICTADVSRTRSPAMKKLVNKCWARESLKETATLNIFPIWHNRNFQQTAIIIRVSSLWLEKASSKFASLGTPVKFLIDMVAWAQASEIKLNFMARLCYILSTLKMNHIKILYDITWFEFEMENGSTLTLMVIRYSALRTIVIQLKNQVSPVYYWLL